MKESIDLRKKGWMVGSKKERMNRSLKKRKVYVKERRDLRKKDGWIYERIDRSKKERVDGWI